MRGRLLSMLSVVMCAGANGAVLFVDDTAPPGGDGSSWAAAYTDLQDALDEVAFLGGAVEIRIAAGVYRPDRGTGDRTMSFVVPGGVALVGGFPDGGGAWSERDHGAHATVLTGDLAGDDDAELESRFDNTEHVVRTATDGAVVAALHGLVIERGFGTAGAGVLLDGNGGVVELFDCTLRDHWAQFGAALSAHGGKAPVVDARGSVFRDNTAVDAGGAVAYSVRGCFEGCEFVGNRVTDEFGQGGAVTMWERASFVSCRFIGNEAAYGGAVGGMGVFEECLFDANRATLEGGAMASTFGEAIVLRCVFRWNEAALAGGAVSGALGSTRVAESLFVGNTTGGEGGALANSVEATACTIVQNSAGAFGGAGSGAWLADCIAWGNIDATHDGVDARAQWADAHARSGGLIEGDAPTGVTADDIFMNFLGPDGLPATGDEDFRLRTGSPAIDAGVAALDAVGASTRDTRGGARFIDLGAGPRRDLGAYEAQDSDRNGVVDAEDIASGALADCDGDGAADIAAGESLLFPRVGVVTTETIGPAPDCSARIAIARRVPLDVGVDVLARTPAGWIVEATLPGPGPGAGGEVIYSVAGADDLAAALWALPEGIFVQVFERDASGWGETALLGPLPGLTESTGAVAVADDQVLVRADDAVQVYERDGAFWSLAQTLPAGLGGAEFDPGTIAHDGGVLALAGGSVAAFAPEVRIYERTMNGEWAEAPSPDIASLVSGSLWSIRAAIGGDLLAVGVASEAARFEVFLFRRDGAAWLFEGAAPIPAGGNMTLNGLATDGALVAAQGIVLGFGAPTTLVFRRVSDQWVFEGMLNELDSGNANAGSLIGAVMNGELVLRDNGGIEAPARALALGGRAGALVISPRASDDCAACPADLTGEGVVDGADLGRVLGAWGGSGDPDLTGDGVVDGSDVGLLLTSWGLCP